MKFHSREKGHCSSEKQQEKICNIELISCSLALGGLVQIISPARLQKLERKHARRQGF